VSTKTYRVVEVDKAPKAPPLTYTEHVWACMAQNCGFTYQLTMSGMGPQALSQVHHVKNALQSHQNSGHFGADPTPQYTHISHSWTVGGW
jgi:hypothetical protein